MKRRSFPLLGGIVFSFLLAGGLYHSPAHAYVSPESTSLSADSVAVKLGASTVIHVQPADQLDPNWSYEWSAQRGALTELTDQHTVTYSPNTATIGSNPWDTVTAKIWDHPLPGPRTLLATRTVTLLLFKQFVILKADDWQRHYWDPTGIGPRWTAYMNYCVNQKRIKTSAGIINYSLDPNYPEPPVPPNDNALAPFIAYTKSLNDTGYVEFWNHGWTHEYHPDPPAWYEFMGSSYEFQTEHLAYGEIQSQAMLGFKYTAFGAPYNAIDETTTTVINESPDIEVWLFGNPGSQKMVLERLSGEIEPVDAGVPDFQGFLETYDPNADYALLQLHPDQDTFVSNFSQFTQIIDYLLALQVTFIKPTEYYNLVHFGTLPLDPRGDIPPQITTQPVSQTVDPLVDVMFNVTNTGSIPMAYQWKKDNQEIPGATLTMYVAPAVTKSDEGTYVCVLTNPAGSVTSSPASLTVNDPPEILEDPESQSVNPGAAVTFFVTVTGSLPLSYQWAKDGDVIAGATEASFSIASAVKTDEGDYICFVSNDAGTILDENKSSNPATLWVMDPPQIIGAPISLSADFGETAQFFVEATGTMPLSFQWRKDGDDILDATDTTLILVAVADLNEGSYDCVVTNGVGTDTSAPATLIVQDPVISTQPGDVHELAGETVQFGVVAFGTGTLAYRWFRGDTPLNDGGDISGSATPILQIANVVNAYQDQYHCDVTGADGTVSSDTAILTITDPAISEEPLSQTVNPTELAVFTVSAVGTSPFNYQWRKNGTNVAGATNDYLAIISATENDEGEYRCLISNSVSPGGTLSNAAVLVVNDPPTISTHPVSQSVDPTDPVVFTVVATGTGPLSYEWRKDAVAVPGATLSSYSIPAVTSDNAGQYTCYVSNLPGALSGQNKESNPAVLTLNAPPVITTQPENSTKNPGESITLSITATGAAPMRYQWRKNGHDMSGKIQSSLSFASLAKTDQGVYTCYVSNSAGTKTDSNVESAPATLTVTDPPTITVQPASQTIAPGYSVTFSVALNGTSPFTYQWKNGVQDISGATNARYTIAHVSQSDQGIYSCYVTNCAGSGLSDQATLTVCAPVSIVTQPISVTVNYGVTTQFTVSVAGTQPIDFQWRKNGVNVSNGGRISGPDAATLHVEASQNGDEGIYTCRVSNVFGAMVSAPAALTVTDPAITSQPQGAQVLAGGTSVFSTGAVGSALTYRWYKDAFALSDGSNISGSSAATLTVTNCTGADNGTYHCLVGGGPDPSLTSASAQLNVGDPAILAQPQSQTVDPDYPVSFSLLLDPASTLPVAYQWRKNGGNIPGVSGILTSLNVHNPVVYEIQHVLQSHEGIYTCYLAGIEGITSAAATLTVNNPPVVEGPSISPPSGQIHPTNSASLTVQVTAGTPPFSYQWSKDGTDVDDTGRVTGSHTTSLVINAAIQDDEGVYTCTVTNSAGRATANSVQLTVGDLIGFIQEPQTQKQYVNHEATFTVQVIGGRGTIAYAWKFDNGHKTSASLASASSSSTWTIPNLTLADAGSYWCDVTDERDTYSSDIAMLEVAPALQIIQQPHDGHAHLGSAYTFTVLAEGGFPPLAYEWCKDGQPVPGATGTSLVIPAVHSTDAGTYSVVVSDSNTAVQQSHDAVLQADPPIVPLGGFEGLLFLSLLFLLASVLIMRRAFL